MEWKLGIWTWNREEYVSYLVNTTNLSDILRTNILLAYLRILSNLALIEIEKSETKKIEDVMSNSSEKYFCSLQISQVTSVLPGDDFFLSFSFFFFYFLNIQLLSQDWQAYYVRCNRNSVIIILKVSVWHSLRTDVVFQNYFPVLRKKKSYCSV